MSNTIQIKRSSTANSVPTAAQLAQGELAVNLVDRKLYTKNASNAVVQLNPEFNINGLTTTTVATNDFLSFADTSDSGNPKKATVQDVVALGLNATGNAPTYACRAWVNFNGTTSPGTIRASGNVSSVTKNSTGDYTVNFTTAMPDANYSTLPASRSDGPNTGFLTIRANITNTTSATRLITLTAAGSFADSSEVNVAVFR